MFKKTGIAIALAALATGSFAAELSAGKDTKFEVNVDVGAYYQTIKDSKGETSQASLIGKGLNQIQIKSTTTVSDDISVFGQAELDYDPIIDNNIPQTDDLRFGISSKKFGRFTVGQFDSYFEDYVIESIGVAHGDKAFVTEPASSNDGRHLQYLNKFGDLTVALDLTANNNTNTNDGNHGAAFTAAYQLGDFSIGLGYSDVAKYMSESPYTANIAKNVTGLTAAYKFGNTKVIGLYATETANDANKNVKTNYSGVALTHVMGEFDIGVAFQNREAPDLITPVASKAKTYSEWSVGLGYVPFKNMTFYFDLNGLGDTNGKGDVTEIGAIYKF